MLKVGDIIEFIRFHALGHEEWSDNTLSTLIIEGYQNGGFGYVLDEKGELKGIYLGKFIDAETFNILFLVGRNSIRQLFKEFRATYPHIKKFITRRHIHESGVDYSKYTKETRVASYDLNKIRL